MTLLALIRHRDSSPRSSPSTLTGIRALATSPDLVQQQRGDRRRSRGMDLTAAQVEAREVGVERETGAQLACAVVADARIRMGEVRRLRRHGRLDDGHESRRCKLLA